MTDIFNNAMFTENKSGLCIVTFDVPGEGTITIVSNNKSRNDIIEMFINNQIEGNYIDKFAAPVRYNDIKTKFKFVPKKLTNTIIEKPNNICTYNECNKIKYTSYNYCHTHMFDIKSLSQLFDSNIQRIDYDKFLIISGKLHGCIINVTTGNYEFLVNNQDLTIKRPSTSIEDAILGEKGFKSTINKAKEDLKPNLSNLQFNRILEKPFNHEHNSFLKYVTGGELIGMIMNWDFDSNSPDYGIYYGFYSGVKQPNSAIYLHCVRSIRLPTEEEKKIISERRLIYHAMPTRYVSEYAGGKVDSLRFARFIYYSRWQIEWYDYYLYRSRIRV